MSSGSIEKNEVMPEATKSGGGGGRRGKKQGVNFKTFKSRILEVKLNYSKELIMRYREVLLSRLATLPEEDEEGENEGEKKVKDEKIGKRVEEGKRFSEDPDEEIPDLDRLAKTLRAVERDTNSKKSFDIIKKTLQTGLF